MSILLIFLIVALVTLGAFGFLATSMAWFWVGFVAVVVATVLAIAGDRRL